MQVNQSVWDYYKPGFVDPLYAPYVRDKANCRYVNYTVVPSKVPGRDRCAEHASPYPDPTEQGRGNTDFVVDNTYIGSAELVNPDLVRRGRGLLFQRKHASDPCPLGWTSVENGYCQRSVPEYGDFYTKCTQQNRFTLNNTKMKDSYLA